MRDRHSIKGAAELLDAAERLWLRARPTLHFILYIYFSLAGLCGWLAGWHRFIGARSIGTEREERKRRDLLLGNYVARQL